MRYSVDETNKKPAYLQLYEQLREDIVAGIWREGDKLPSKRLLSQECGVSVITVEHALGILCDEGYICTRERSGCFVCYRSADVLPVSRDEGYAGAMRANAHRSTVDFPFSVMAKTMRGVITKYGEQILVKSPNLGAPELRDAIAAYLARSKGMGVEPRQIVIGSGAEYLYSLIVQLLGREGVYAVEDPCYEKIRAVYRANGVTCEPLRLGKDGILSAELAASKACVLHVTPFHSYPSGITADASKRREYLAWAAARNATVIEDDFDSELTVSRKHEDTVFSLSAEGRVIYLNTFTATLAPSMRIGYMVLSPAMMERFLEKLGFYSCTVPVFEQYVLAELIENGHFERHINRVRRRRRAASGKGEF